MAFSFWERTQETAAKRQNEDRRIREFSKRTLQNLKNSKTILSDPKKSSIKFDGEDPRSKFEREDGQTDG